MAHKTYIHVPFIIIVIIIVIIIIIIIIIIIFVVILLLLLIITTTTTTTGGGGGGGRFKDIALINLLALPSPLKIKWLLPGHLVKSYNNIPLPTFSPRGLDQALSKQWESCLVKWWFREALERRLWYTAYTPWMLSFSRCRLSAKSTCYAGIY